MPREDVRALLRGRSLLLLPSRHDTFNLTALEALALGCPTLVSEHAGVASWLRGRLPGLGWAVVQIDCARGAAAAAATVLADYDRHRDAVAEAWQRAALQGRVGRARHEAGPLRLRGQQRRHQRGHAVVDGGRRRILGQRRGDTGCRAVERARDIAVGRDAGSRERIGRGIGEGGVGQALLVGMRLEADRWAGDALRLAHRPQREAARDQPRLGVAEDDTLEFAGRARRKARPQARQRIALGGAVDLGEALGAALHLLARLARVDDEAPLGIVEGEMRLLDRRGQRQA
ncbi:MAG: hypothetical protein B7Z40_15650 [Bosea sp. 12-68-7]|nr:MAG: hypothetical protein B7Z40_15650 [Bosea sp. 12-68-7]